jgi:hypothetical protein
MQIHGRAKLGPGWSAGAVPGDRGRIDVQAGRGLPERFARDSAPVVAPICRRFASRATLIGRWAADRSSRPRCSPGLLGAGAQEQICEARRHTGWGPRLIAGQTGHPHSTVWKVLHRHGLSRRPRAPRDAVRRYEWPCPGDLLHMDTARYARFERPGHRVTGDRSHRARNWMADSTRVGYDFAHAIVDDHSRLAYVELHGDERAATITAFVKRALAWFDHHGVEAKRLMTRQCLELRQEPVAARVAHRPPDQAPAHPGLSASDQWEGGAFPPDHGQRVGLRHDLRLTPRSQPRPATLARALQHA